MNKIKLFIIFMIYIFDLILYFSAYSYSKQNDWIILFIITLSVNLVILFFNKYLIIISLSTNITIYMFLFFFVITDKFNFRDFFIKKFIFYFFQFQLTGNWLIPIMKHQIKRIRGK